MRKDYFRNMSFLNIGIHQLPACNLKLRLKGRRYNYKAYLVYIGLSMGFKIVSSYSVDVKYILFSIDNRRSDWMNIIVECISTMHQFGRPTVHCS